MPTKAGTLKRNDYAVQRGHKTNSLSASVWSYQRRGNIVAGGDFTSDGTNAASQPHDAGRIPKCAKDSQSALYLRKRPASEGSRGRISTPATTPKLQKASAAGDKVPATRHQLRQETQSPGRRQPNGGLSSASASAC